MKKTIFACLCFIAIHTAATAQSIESVVSNHSVPSPSFNSGANAGDAVDIIMHFLNSYASVTCANSMGASLTPKIAELKTKYRKIIPPGATVEFLVLTNKFTCSAIAIVQKTQEVHVIDNACSIHDIHLVQPDLMPDPVTTGYFSIKVKF